MKRRNDLDDGPWNGNPGGVMTVGAPHRITLEARRPMKLKQGNVNGIVANEKRRLQEKHAVEREEIESKAYSNGFLLGFKAGLAIGLCVAVCGAMLLAAFYFKWFIK